MEQGIAGTLLVIIILIAVICMAVRGTIRDKCGGDCSSCGAQCSSKNAPMIREGQTERKNAIGCKKVVEIGGFKDSASKSVIEGAVNTIDGVACVAEPKKKRALVFSNSDVSDDEIRERIEGAGFTVKKIVREI